MSDDLAAIRLLVASWRRIAPVLREPSPYAEDLADGCDTLLALVEEQAAEIARLREERDRYRGIADLCAVAHVATCPWDHEEPAAEEAGRG